MYLALGVMGVWVCGHLNVIFVHMQCRCVALDVTGV